MQIVHPRRLLGRLSLSRSCSWCCLVIVIGEHTHLAQFAEKFVSYNGMNGEI